MIQGPNDRLLVACPDGKAILMGLAPQVLRTACGFTDRTVELDWDVRQKTVLPPPTRAGRELGIFLPRGTLVPAATCWWPKTAPWSRDCRAPAGAGHHPLPNHG